MFAQKKTLSDQLDDYLTIKYDPSGNELWTARSDWDGFFDQGYAIDADGSGNLYVVGGSSNGTGHNWDVLTIKYDAASGAELWVTPMIPSIPAIPISRPDTPDSPCFQGLTMISSRII